LYHQSLEKMNLAQTEEEIKVIFIKGRKINIRNDQKQPPTHAFANPQGYLQDKIRRFKKWLLNDDSEGFFESHHQRILLFGVPIQVTSENDHVLLDKVIKQENLSVKFKQVVTRDGVHEQEKRKSSRKPRQVEFEDLTTGDVIRGLVVDPGHDYLQSYCDYFTNDEEFIEKKITVDAYLVVPESPQQFAGFYGINLTIFSEAMKDAVVVVGGGFDDPIKSEDDLGPLPPMQRAFNNWKPDDPFDHTTTSIWFAHCFTHQLKPDTYKPVVFLDWYASYWGDLAYKVGELLVHVGANAIIHAGSKVGALAGTREKKDSSNIFKQLWCPQKFQVVKGQHDIGNSFTMEPEFDACNFYTKRSGSHVSIPCALLEKIDLIRELSRAGNITTIDDEGAYFAQLAEEGKIRFGAFYWVSDEISVNPRSAKEELANKINPMEKRERVLMLEQIGEFIRMGQYSNAKDGEREDVLMKLVPDVSFKYETLKEKQNEYLEGTRSWVFDEFETWFNTLYEKPGVFGVQGVGGMGKSVIAAEIIKRYGAAALHFFKHDEADKGKAGLAIGSLARQLSESIPGFRNNLLASLKEISKSDAELITKDIESVFLRFIVTPAKECSRTVNGEKPHLIVLDAIDECVDSDRSVLLYVLKKLWPQMPCGYGLIITGRPDDISHAGFDRIKIIKQEDVDNMLDIKKYVNIKLPGNKFDTANAAEEIRNAIIKGSDGLFIFARLVVEDILERIGNGTVSDSSQVPENLNKLYENWLTRYKNYLIMDLKLDPDQASMLYVGVLSPIVVAREPLSLGVWKEIFRNVLQDVYQTKFTSNLTIETKFKSHVLDPLQRLLDVNKNDVKVLHKTMADFLLNDHGISSKYQTPEELRVDKAEGHCLLAIACDVLYDKFMEENGNKLCAPTKSNAQVFAIRHAVHHALKARSFGKCHEIDVVKWTTDLERVFNWLNVGVKHDENRFNQMVLDGKAAAGDSLLGGFIMEVVELGRESVLLDPRMLAGQILGRIRTNEVLVEPLNKKYFGKQIMIRWLRFVRKTPFGGIKVLFLNLAYNGSVLMSCMSLMFWIFLVQTWILEALPLAWALENLPLFLRTLVSFFILISNFLLLFEVWYAITSGRDPDRGLSLASFIFITRALWLYGEFNLVSLLFMILGFLMIVMNFYVGHHYGNWRRFIMKMTPKKSQVYKLMWEMFYSFLLSSAFIWLGDLFRVAVVTTMSSFGVIHVATRIPDIDKKWEKLENLIVGKIKSPHRADARELANKLLKKIRDEENVKIAVPVGELSGLDQVGEAMRMVIRVDFDVASIFVSPNGKTIAMGSRDRTVHVWDLERGKEIDKFHYDEMGLLLFSPDGKIMASGPKDKTINIWNVENWRKIHKLEGHLDEILVLSFSSNGKTLLSGDLYGVILTWSVETWTIMHKVQCELDNMISISLLFSSNGKYVLSSRWATANEIGGLGNTMKMSDSWDMDVDVCDLDTGKRIFKFSFSNRVVSFLKDVFPICFSPDGMTIVAGSEVLDVENKRPLYQLQNCMISISAVCYSPNGKYIVTGSIDGTLHVWSAENGKMIRSLEGHVNSVIQILFMLTVNTLALSVSFDRTVRLWDITRTNTNMKDLIGHSSNVNYISISSDSKYVVSSSLERLQICDAHTGDEKQCFTKKVEYVEGHGASTSGHVGFSPNNLMVASCSNGNIVVWHIHNTWKQYYIVTALNDIRLFAFSPNGTWIVVARPNNSLTLYDYQQSKRVCDLRGLGDDGPLVCLCFSPDEKRIVSSSEKKIVSIWEIAEGRKVKTLHTVRICRFLRFSNDGKFIFSHDETGIIACWNSQTFFQEDTTRPLEDFPISNVPVVVVDGAVQFSSSDGKRIVGFVVPLGSSDWIYSQYSPKAPIIICGRRGNQVCLWKVE
jgi:WD40 repeat protein